jgi:hypothetical protein
MKTNRENPTRRPRAERDERGIPIPRRYREQRERDALPRAALIPVGSLRVGRLPDTNGPVHLAWVLRHAERIRRPYIHYPPLVARSSAEPEGRAFDLLSPTTRLRALTQGYSRSRVRVYAMQWLSDAEARVLGLAEWCRADREDRRVLTAAWALTAMRDTLKTAGVAHSYPVLMGISGLAKGTISQYVAIGDGLPRALVAHVVADCGVAESSVLSLKRDVLLGIVKAPDGRRANLIRAEVGARAPEDPGTAPPQVEPLGILCPGDSADRAPETGGPDISR